MNDTPRSTAEEAQDPSTSPERLMELTERHPQLQGLIVANPSCPDVARQWILATNQRVRAQYEAAQQDEPAEPAEQEPAEQDPDDGPPTQAMDRTVAPPPLRQDQDQDLTDRHPAASVDEPATAPGGDPDAESVWGLPPVADAPAAAPTAEQRPAPAAPASSGPSASTGSVREVRSGRGVVPLGPSESAGDEQAGYGYGVAATAPAAAAAAAASQPPTAAYPAASAGGVVAGDDGGEDDPGRSRATWWACGGCLLLALILALVAVFGVRAWLSDDEDASDQSAPTSTSASKEPSEKPSTSKKEETSEEDKSPAPDDAKDLDSIISPSQNISCTLDDDSVGCSINDRSYGGDLEDCSSGVFSIEVSDGDADVDCGTSYGAASPPETLEYGGSAASGDVACRSESSGMTCWNVKTGHGFEVNRGSYDTF